MFALVVGLLHHEAAEKCVADIPLLDGINLGLGLTSKLDHAWVSAWHGVSGASLGSVL